MKPCPTSLVIVSLFLISDPARSQPFAFTTIAGVARTTGKADGTNSSARFNSPYGLAVDGAGNIFVADHDNNAIRKITPVGTNWVVTTIAGVLGQQGSTDGTNSKARFFFPDGVAVDTNGTLFVADSANNTIRKITPQGTNWVVRTLAGNTAGGGYADGTNNQASFFEPTGIAVDNAGNLFVTDFSYSLIRRIAPVGTNWVVSTIAGAPRPGSSVDGTNSQARFANPRGIVVDSSGTIFVGDYFNFTIRKITPVGTNWVVTTIAGLAGQAGTADGTNSDARFNAPQGVALDSAGNLYVADSNFQSTNANNLIRKLSPQGTNWVVTTLGGAATVYGSADGTGSNARFNNPWGIALDSTGNVYVADFGNSTIRRGQSGGAPVSQLQITRSSDSDKQIVLSWPATETNAVLESTSTLSAGALWTPLSNGIAISRESFVLTNTAGAGPAFYRLNRH